MVTAGALQYGCVTCGQPFNGGRTEKVLPGKTGPMLLRGKLRDSQFCFYIHSCSILSIMSTNSKEFSLYSASSCAGVNFNRFRRRALVTQSTY